MLEVELLEMGYVIDSKTDDCNVYVKDNICLMLSTRDNGLIEGNLETRFGIIKMSVGPFVYPNNHFKAFERGLMRAIEKLEEG